MQRRAGLMMAVLTVLAGGICIESQARSGEGIRLGNCTISPSAGASVTYDSNVYLTEDNVQEDVFLEGIAALDIGYASDKTVLGGRLFGVKRSYFDQSDIDYSSAGEVIRMEHRRLSGFVVQADHSFRRVQDLDRSGLMPAPGDVSAIASPVVSFTVADRSRRDLHNAGVRVGCDLTDKIDASVAYAYTMVDYDLDAILDASEYVGLAEGGYRVTDKTVATLAVQYGLEDTDAFEDNADFVAARVGLRSSRTDKIQYKGGIGWQTYMRPNEAGEDASGVSLNATATWQATDKIAVEAGARNDILASSIYKNNVRETASGLVGVNYRATAAVTASFTGAHAREEHKDPVDIGGGATKIRKDESTTVSSRVSYAAPVRLVSLFVEVSYGVVNSTISDYTELRGGAGMTVRY